MNSGPWTRPERHRLIAIIGVIAFLHLLGVSLYLGYSANPAAAGSLAGAGMLAYVLGVRHAFDADHIAAIDDTTRIMLLRGRRPVGVGFFFAMGHSTVVVGLSIVAAFGASRLNSMEVGGVAQIGGYVASGVALMFLLLVAGLNTLVLRNLLRLSDRVRRGENISDDLDRTLADRGVLVRILGSKLRGLIRSSWHMYPIGLLMGLGLETASEVTLLTLTASAATGGHTSLMAVLSLPLLFAAGMATCDTADSLFMTRAYSWSWGDPQRRLHFNTATTGATVAIGFVVAAIYLAGILSALPNCGWMAPVGALSDNFEFLGYAVVSAFALTWTIAMVISRSGRTSHTADRSSSDLPRPGMG